MRNSAKRRNVSLAFTAVAAVALAVNFAMHRGVSPLNGGWFAIAIFTFFITVGFIVAAVVFHTHVRWQDRLRRGDKRLAQWTLSPIEWGMFRANDQTWRKSGRPNSLKFRKETPANGVEVLVAQDAVMIDDDFYSLGALSGLQWIPETPASLEYNMVTSTKNGTIKWNIRFPVAASAEQQARAVWDYVHRPMPATDARTVRRLRFFRTFGLVSAGVSALALLLTTSVYANKQQSPLLWVFAVALGGFPFGLILAATCHRQLRAFARTKPAA